MNNCPSNLWKLTSLSSLLTEGMMYISIYITVLYIYIWDLFKMYDYLQWIISISIHVSFQNVQLVREIHGKSRKFAPKSCRSKIQNPLVHIDFSCVRILSTSTPVGDCFVEVRCTSIFSSLGGLGSKSSTNNTHVQLYTPGKLTCNRKEK